MALLAEALTTLANTKQALGVPSGTTTDDTLITDLINAATKFIQNELGRKLVRRTYNDATTAHATTSVPGEERYIFSGDGSAAHALPNRPIIATGFVLEELASRISSGETWATLTLYVDYVIDVERGIIRLLDWTFATDAPRNYRVTYTGGYQEANAAPFVPADLERACHELVKQEYRHLGTVTSEGIAGWSRSFNTDQSRSFVERTLDHYRSNAPFA